MPVLSEVAMRFSETSIDGKKTSGIILLGFSASRLLGFSASRLLGFSASRLPGFPASAACARAATGSSPTNSDELARMAGVWTNDVFALRFNRNTNANDVTLVVEGSEAATNDAAWSGIATNSVGSWGGATNVSETGTGTPVSVTVQDATPQSGAATNRFLRLRVTRP